MKLTDFLQDVGRPIAYYPSLRKITGSTNATILLCQFIYWRGKEADPNGWLFKESADIEEETGLSYDEQKTARAKLKAAGLVEEHYARLDHRMGFRLNLDAINEKWGTLQIHIPEQGNATFGKADLPSSLNSNTENTTQNTTDIKTDETKGEYNVVEEANKTMDAILEFEGQAQKNGEATNSFEACLGFGILPWDSTSSWRKFRDWVLSVHNQEPSKFKDFQKWRVGDGKYQAMSNNKIRQNPQMFIDTGWPTYLAHSEMYGANNGQYQQSTKQPEYTDADRQLAARIKAQRQAASV